MLIVSAGAEHEVFVSLKHRVTRQLKPRHALNKQGRDANNVIACIISSTGSVVQCIAHEFKKFD